MFKGDNTGAHHVYVWKNHTSSALPDILQAMRDEGYTPAINPEAVSFLLHNSLIPSPQTIYKDVYVLGIGDQLSSQYDCDFPYFQERTSGASQPSTRKLLDLLSTSVQRKLAGRSVSLMLSSGKDSVAIALALKEVGLEKEACAYTYCDPESGYTDEGEEATRIADKLGLKHKVISVPDDPKTVKTAMLSFFENTAMPTCDPATTPYFLGLHQEGVQDTALLDGTRNDIYMGIVPTQKYDMLGRYYQILGGGWNALRSLRQRVPFYLKANKFLSTFPEVHLYKHGHFRHIETAEFFAHNTDTEKFWLDIYRRYKTHPATDLRTFIIGQYFDGCGVTVKGETVAQALDSDFVMPWADADLADYVFNLPQKYKYDMHRRTNKILLREMLKEYLGYDAQKIGKRVFYFNSDRFVLNNEGFVKEEILGCKLWSAGMQDALPRYFDKLENEPRVGGALLGLFMISGWHNHSKYLKGGA